MAKGDKDVGFYIAPTQCKIMGNKISNVNTGILIGDSKDLDWTGKFDVKRYPSRTMQDVPPSDNNIGNNQITSATVPIKTQ
jgi:poly(beta-D-mannuronate) lyase